MAKDNKSNNNQRGPQMMSVDQISEEDQQLDKVNPEEEAEAEAQPIKSNFKEPNLYNPRVYAQEPGAKIETKVQLYDSHLFKLTPAKTYKNTGKFSDDPEADQDQFTYVEHTHHFRTRDSEGKMPMASTKIKPQSGKPGAVVMKSTPIAGHFHLIELIPHADATKPPIILSISPPMIMSKVKKTPNSKNKTVPCEVEQNHYDKHVHRVIYLNTEKVSHKTKNAEAQIVIAADQQKGAPIPGVI